MAHPYADKMQGRAMCKADGGIVKFPISMADADKRRLEAAANVKSGNVRTPKAPVVLHPGVKD